MACETEKWIDDGWICIRQIGTGWKNKWIGQDQKSCYQFAIWDHVMKVFSWVCTSAVWVACKHVCINLAGSFGQNKQAGSWKLRLAAWLLWFQKAQSRYRQISKGTVWKSFVVWEFNVVRLHLKESWLSRISQIQETSERLWGTRSPPPVTTFSLVCSTWLAALDAISTTHEASSLSVELKTSLILAGLILYIYVYIYIWV